MIRWNAECNSCRRLNLVPHSRCWRSWALREFDKGTVQIESSGRHATEYMSRLLVNSLAYFKLLTPRLKLHNQCYCKRRCYLRYRRMRLSLADPNDRLLFELRKLIAYQLPLPPWCAPQYITLLAFVAEPKFSRASISPKKVTCSDRPCIVKKGFANALYITRWFRMEVIFDILVWTR